MIKSRTNLTVKNSLGYRVNSNVLVAKEGPFASGDILDANATKELVSDEVIALVDDEVDAKIADIPVATSSNKGMMSSEDKSKLDSITPGGGGGMTNITYSELKALRDNGTLVPGQWYRITDYVTTTTQPYTRSAGHPFDIILQADSNTVLSEDALAIKHDDDNYFADSKLEAWELKYCIDNDTTRFDWADTNSGKGIIYWMKDEFNNECPYDFKNIQFASYKVLAFDKNPDLVDTYSGYKNNNGNLYPYGAAIDASSELYRFTFDYISTEESNDHSLKSKKCYNNVIKQYYNGDKLKLNNIVLGGNNNNTDTTKNKFGIGCYDMRFGKSCKSNTFGDDCYSNTFGDDCYSNTFGNYCYFNTFEGADYHNTFGNYCRYNTFGDNCKFNTFGDNCESNTFGDRCRCNEVLNDTSNCHIQYIEYHILTSNEVIYDTDELYQTKNNVIYPISHPDLSTQPSILPLRFGNLDMYEVLSRVEDASYDYLDELEYEPNSLTHVNLSLENSNIDITLVEQISRGSSSINMGDVYINVDDNYNILAIDLTSSHFNEGDIFVKTIIVSKESDFAFLAYNDNYYMVNPNIRNSLSIYRNGEMIFLLQYGGGSVTFQNLVKQTSTAMAILLTKCEINLQTIEYKYLKDLETSAKPIFASAFNDANCESVRISKEDIGDWYIKSELDFVPSFVLIQYYKGENGYQY